MKGREGRRGSMYEGVKRKGGREGGEVWRRKGGEGGEKGEYV